MTVYRVAIQTLVLALLLLTAGCKDREVTAYRAPKDDVSAMPPSMAAGNLNDLPKDHPPIGPMAGGAGPTPQMESGSAPAAAGNALAWTAPARWQAKALSAMRKGSYTVPGDGGASADLSIIAFPGDTGGLFANVNRWRGQVGLAPVEAAQLEANITHLEINGLHVSVVDFAGQSDGAPVRLIGAIVPCQGQTWFFKLTGPDELVAREKPVFLEFLQSVQAASKSNEP